MNNFHWDCQRSATITDSNCSINNHCVDKNSKDNEIVLMTKVIICPNESCKEYSISASLFLGEYLGHNIYPKGKAIFAIDLKPASKSKQFPEYVPVAIRLDYHEACLIRSLSPKASATLARRCIQGMIRDFFGAKGRTLFDEINTIQDKVDPLTWEAINAVRSIGNIGAHMEKDINIIVDVDSNEAELLIGLIEFLIKDWYITRNDREQKLKAIIGIAADKKIDQKS